MTIVLTTLLVAMFCAALVAGDDRRGITHGGSYLAHPSHRGPLLEHRDHLQMPVGTRIYVFDAGSKAFVYPGASLPDAVAGRTPDVIVVPDSSDVDGAKTLPPSRQHGVNVSEVRAPHY